MGESKDYKINIDPRILELLGPSLYTNIYYVLAELIANAYDADASNVYIIEDEESITVEDDGTGMSYSKGDINRYLNVAVETRTPTENIFTESGKRKRMGRKGVGKLAALSVSENVHVMTAKEGELSGFVLSRKIGENNKLIPLEEEDIQFKIIQGNGTSIVMMQPQYGLHKTPQAIKKNLLKIFPLINKDFKIHLIKKKKKPVTIESFDNEMIKELGGIYIFGEDFKHLKDNFNSELDDKYNSKMINISEGIKKDIYLKDSSSNKNKYTLEILGWIGIYRSTRGRKSDPEDFPDNFISLLSNKKLGEFNILPAIGKNRLNEVYIVGQLHVDLFENPELPDMALSNRQGYKSDDKRYIEALALIREKILPKATDLRAQYATFKKTEQSKQKLVKQQLQEAELGQKVEEYKRSASNSAAQEIISGLTDADQDKVQNIIQNKLNEFLPIVGLKQKVDRQKRKIMISHDRSDKDLADVIYKMLIFNNIQGEDIIYSTCDDYISRIPEGTSIFDYLRDFFVNSYSDEKIYVIYVTSDSMSKSWFTVSEVGAGWIAKSKHKIFNVNSHVPKRPLDIDKTWHNSKIKNNNVYMTDLSVDDFAIKIIDICNEIGAKPKDLNSNKKELSRHILINN